MFFQVDFLIYNYNTCFLPPLLAGRSPPPLNQSIITACAMCFLMISCKSHRSWINFHRKMAHKVQWFFWMENWKEGGNRMKFKHLGNHLCTNKIMIVPGCLYPFSSLAFPDFFIHLVVSLFLPHFPLPCVYCTPDWTFFLFFHRPHSRTAIFGGLGKNPLKYCWAFFTELLAPGRPIRALASDGPVAIRS
jgi:hypothetical protein